MLAELRMHLGSELDRLSHELLLRMPAEHGSNGDHHRDGRGREVQRILQRRIRLLGQLVAGLASVDAGVIWPDRAGYGSLVLIREHGTDTEHRYTLMAGDLIDLDEGQVSLDSPIGHALLGRRPGDEVTVETPRGVRRFELLSLVTLPQKLKMVGPGFEESAAEMAAQAG